MKHLLQIVNHLHLSPYNFLLFYLCFQRKISLALIIVNHLNLAFHIQQVILKQLAVAHTMNIAGNNMQYEYVCHSGTLNVMGNCNEINLKNCDPLLINIMGNANIINLVSSRAQANINGNNNCVQLVGTQLLVGLNGNNNSVEKVGHTQQQDSKVTLTHNNGANNRIPNQSQNSFNEQSHISNHNVNNQSYCMNMSMVNGMNMMPLFQYNLGYQNYRPLRQISVPPPFNGGFNVPMIPMFNPFGMEGHMNMIQNPSNNPFYNSSHQNVSNSYLNRDRTNTSSSRVNSSSNNEGRSRSNIRNNSSSRFGRRYNEPFVRFESQFQRQGRMIQPRNNRRNEQSRNRYDFNVQPQSRYEFNANENSRGLTAKELNMLPRSEHVGEIKKCTICLEDIVKGSQVIYLFCIHCFHSDCTMDWLKKSGTCPLCQLEIIPYLKAVH